MAKYVDEKIANNAAEKGTLIGTTEPCADSKGSWWEVYLIGEEIIACVVTDIGVSCGKLISESELDSYCDDAPAAVEKIMRMKDRPIPHNALCFFLDGNQWCCVFGDFINLQESPAGFGDSFETAMASLQEQNAERIASIRACEQDAKST